MLPPSLIRLQQDVELRDSRDKHHERTPPQTVVQVNISTLELLQGDQVYLGRGMAVLSHPAHAPCCKFESLISMDVFERSLMAADLLTVAAFGSTHIHHTIRVQIHMCGWRYQLFIQS